MIDFSPLLERWRGTELAPWADTLLDDISAQFHAERHGDLPRWEQALASLPPVTPSSIALDADCVTVGAPGDIDDSSRQELEKALRGLHPWRKGPFELFGVHIDTEWRSAWNWALMSSS